MLEKQDLQIIQEMMDKQEQRILDQTNARIDAVEKRILDQTDAKISASEKRILDQTNARIDAVEKRIDQTNANMEAMEKRILEQSAINMRVILESYVEPKFNLLADAVQSINEKLDRMPTAEDLEITNGRIDVLEAIVKRLSRDVAELKKAQ